MNDPFKLFYCSVFGYIMIELFAEFADYVGRHGL